MSIPPISSRVTLVFDWGNTIMKVFPQYSGPMAEWPEVAEIDGVVEALEALLGRYRMVLATNAGVSNAGLVWKALKRVGLGEYFKAIFTANELGKMKPDPGFYQQLESVLDRTPTEMVMVGDDYRTDILGAKTAAWKAIWYNPGGLSAPGLLPLHDAEIQDLRELPKTVEHLALPDYPTCLAWLLERGIPYNILDHIQLVAALAYQLAVWMRSKGAAVDPVLTQRGAMLHDLAKIDSVRPPVDRSLPTDHADLARTLLIAHGQPDLAEIAGRHMLYQDPQDPRRPQTWEQKLVHYADKLAEGARLVPIEERLQALKKRYPQAAQEMEASWPVLDQLQQEICKQLETTAAELIERLRAAIGQK